MSRADVTKALGATDFELNEPAACTNAVYVVNREILDPQKVQTIAPDDVQVSTLRLVYRDGHVAAVEVNGPAARSGYDFGSVRIGDTADDVRLTLGAPEVLSTQVWSYQSLRVLLDDDGRQVTALAVTEDDGLTCLLPATFRLSCDTERGVLRAVAITRPPPDELHTRGAAMWPGTIMWRPADGCRGLPSRRR